MEHDLLDRRVHLVRLDAVLHLHRVSHADVRQASRRELLGRRGYDAGMDPAVAAAVPQFRGTAAHRAGCRACALAGPVYWTGIGGGRWTSSGGGEMRSPPRLP